MFAVCVFTLPRTSGIQNFFSLCLVAANPPVLMQCLFLFRRGHQQPAGPAEPHHRHFSREREAEVRSEAHPAAEAEGSVRPVQDAHRNRCVPL